MKAKRVETTVLGILAFLAGLQIAAIYVKVFVNYLQDGSDALNTFLSVFTGVLFGLVLMAFGVVVLFTGKKERPIATACLAAISAAWAFSLLYNYLKDTLVVGWDVIELQFRSYQDGAPFIAVILGLGLGIWGCVHAGGYMKRMRAAYEAQEEEPCNTEVDS